MSKIDVDCGSDSLKLMDVKSEEIIKYLKEMLDKPVLIPIPLGKKGPKFKGWQRIRYETIPWAEIERAVVRGGNIGIILGPPSGNLVTVDLDSDDEMKQFFDFAPWAKETYISRGAKGCQCWFIIEGEYPSKRTIWKAVDGHPIVEFRGGDIQSVTWGRHPDTGERYQTNGKKVKHISYLDLQEYHNYLQEQCGECDQEIYRSGQTGDFEWIKRYRGCNLKELDLIGMLKEAGIKYKVKNEEKIDKYAIRCPWIDEHTKENSEWDATVHMFEPRGIYWPAFKCLHSHCDSRGLKDLLEWLEVAHGLGPGTVRKYCGGKRGRIEVVDRSEIILVEPILPTPIIDGLLRPATKMVMASKSKIGKTWLAMGLGLSLAAGNPFLGFDTCQSKVLYLNLELTSIEFDWRLYQIEKARRLMKLPPNSFKAANLMGADILMMGLEEKQEALIDVCERVGPIDILVIDPIYVFLGDLDENKASDVAKLLGMFDAVSRHTGTATIPIHHFSKGNFLEKKMGDRSSGSGVFQRNPSTYVEISELGSVGSGEAKVETSLRGFPPVSPFGIRWDRDTYQWQRDPTIETSKTKSYTNEDKLKAKPPTVAEKMIKVLAEFPEGMNYTSWMVEVTEARKICSSGSFSNNFTDLKRLKRIKQKENGRWIVVEPPRAGG